MFDTLIYICVAVEKRVKPKRYRRKNDSGGYNVEGLPLRGVSRTCTLNKGYGFNPRKFPTMKDVSSRSIPATCGKVPRPCTPDQDVSCQSIPSSCREMPGPCTPTRYVSSQSVPFSFRKVSGAFTPHPGVSSQSVPASFRNISRPDTPHLSQAYSYQSCPSSIQTVAINLTFSQNEPLDKNMTSSYSHTKCVEGPATKGHFLDTWFPSWCKNIQGSLQVVDAWETALKHSSKPTVNSAISWTDEELLSIEESLSGFSTGYHPFPATMIFYVLCGVLCVLAAAGTILLHSSLTTEAALWWLVCVAAGVVLHVLVLEPIKAVLVLAYASNTRKKLY